MSEFCPICSTPNCKVHTMFGQDVRARTADPDTSHEGARVARKGSASKSDVLVLELLHLNGDLTTREMGECTDKNLTLFSSRLKPLRKRGLVERTGEKRKCESVPDSTPGYVYRITAAGRAALGSH